MIKIQCEPWDWDVHSDYCEKDGVVSDCIAEFGNSLTGSFYIFAALALCYWICNLQIPIRTFSIPLTLFCLGVSTIVFHVNLSSSWGFIGSYFVYLFFTTVNIYLVGNESWRRLKTAGIIALLFFSIIMDQIIFQSYDIHFIEGMFSIFHLILTMSLVILHQRSDRTKKFVITRYYLARCIVMIHVLLFVKLIEALTPCKIDTIGICRWSWHLFSAFAAYYGGLCACFIVAENDFSFTEKDMKFLLKKAPHIPNHLRIAQEEKKYTPTYQDIGVNSFGDLDLYSQECHALSEVMGDSVAAPNSPCFSVPLSDTFFYEVDKQHIEILNSPVLMDETAKAAKEFDIEIQSEIEAESHPDFKKTMFQNDDEEIGATSPKFCEKNKSKEQIPVGNGRKNLKEKVEQKINEKPILEKLPEKNDDRKISKQEHRETKNLKTKSQIEENENQERKENFKIEIIPMDEMGHSETPLNSPEEFFHQNKMKKYTKLSSQKKKKACLKPPFHTSIPKTNKDETNSNENFVETEDLSDQVVNGIQHEIDELEEFLTNLMEDVTNVTNSMSLTLREGTPI